MQITQQTDYALRILMFTAINNDRLVTIAEIASLYQISQSHLTKIVATLTKHHYLIGRRGKGGGISLAKKAGEINIGEVIRQFEPLHLVECLGEDNRCIITPHCHLKSLFKEARDAFLAIFDRYTLSDLTDNPALQNQLKKQID